MDAGQFGRIAKALADPRRFAILSTVARCQETGCQQLCGQFDVSQPTISHHLRELANAGLVESRREGQYVFYSVRPGVLDEYVAELRRRVPVPGRVTA